MSTSYIIALDQGTSSCRALAVDPQGRIFAQEQRVFSPRRLRKGLSEYDGKEVLETQLTVLHALLDRIGPQHAAAIAVCSQRSTVVLWDQTTGEVLAPVLTWEDGRALKQSEEVSLSQAQVHLQTGLFKTPYFSAPKIAWCLQEIASVQQAARQGTLLIGPVATHLIWHLTKGAVFASDPTLAHRTLLWNIDCWQWSEKLCQAFGVPVSCLPHVFPSAADYGAYIYKGVSIPIYACVADQQAAAAYHGLRVGKTSINYGTGAFVLHHTGEKLAVLPGMLSSVAATVTDRERAYLLEGPVFSAGSVLEWLRAKGFLADLDELERLCSQAREPVQFLPALGGLGAPYWDYRTQVGFRGITPQTKSADWIAGALQGIACRIADIIYYLRAQGQKVQSPVQVSGGLVRSNYLLAFQADILQTQLYVCPHVQSTALGAALLAGRKLGWKVENWLQAPIRMVSPHISAVQSQARYQTWQHFVQSVRNI